MKHVLATCSINFHNMCGKMWQEHVKCCGVPALLTATFVKSLATFDRKLSEATRFHLSTSQRAESFKLCLVKPSKQVLEAE